LKFIFYLATIPAGVPVIQRNFIYSKMTWSWRPANLLKCQNRLEG